MFLILSTDQDINLGYLTYGKQVLIKLFKCFTLQMELIVAGLNIGTVRQLEFGIHGKNYK